MQFRILKRKCFEINDEEFKVGALFQLNPHDWYPIEYGKLQYRISHIDPWRDVKVEIENAQPNDNGNG